MNDGHTTGGHPTVGTPRTPAQWALIRAGRDCWFDGRSRLGSGDLLVALARDPDSVAARLLDDRRVSFSWLAGQVSTGRGCDGETFLHPPGEHGPAIAQEAMALLRDTGLSAPEAEDHWSRRQELQVSREASACVKAVLADDTGEAELVEALLACPAVRALLAEWERRRAGAA